MRIAWSVPVFAAGLGEGRGDLVRARALVDTLRAQGHRVRVVEARQRPGRELEETVHRGLIERLPLDRLRMILRDGAWWWRSRGHGRRVAEQATEFGADVLVETQVHGVVSGAVAARATGLPLALDDVSPPSEARRLGAALPALSRAAFRTQLAEASLLVAPTAGIRERVDDGAPPVRTAVIANGIDSAAHRSASVEAGRRAVGGDGDFVVGFVGSFQPWHDVPTLVRAFAELAESAPARLLLAGDGPGREEALAISRELGVYDRVLSPGRVPPDRIPTLLAGCDAGVLPGTNDYGHPMKLLEYAAAGLPIVAPDVAAVQAVMGDSRADLRFRAGDSSSLAGGLELLARSPEARARLGRRARVFVAAGSDWEDRGRRLSRLLRGTVSGKQAGPTGPGGG